MNGTQIEPSLRGFGASVNRGNEAGKENGNAAVRSRITNQQKLAGLMFCGTSGGGGEGDCPTSLFVSWGTSKWES